MTPEITEFIIYSVTKPTATKKAECNTKQSIESIWCERKHIPAGMFRSPLEERSSIDVPITKYNILTRTRSETRKAAITNYERRQRN